MLNIVISKGISRHCFIKMTAQASTEESESVIGRIDVVGVGEIRKNQNLEGNGRDDDNDIDGNDFNYLEERENEIVDENDAVNNNIDNEKDKAEELVIDLIANENENDIPEVEVAFIENFNAASKSMTGSSALSFSLSTLLLTASFSSTISFSRSSR